MGWPTAAAVAYSCAVGAFIIPVCLGVNVNGIAPGYIATDNTAALRADPIFFAYGSNGVQRLREQVRDDSVLATNWKSLRARWTTPCSTLNLCQRTSASGTVRSCEVDGLIGEKGPNPLKLVASRVKGKKALFATALTTDGTKAEVLSVGGTGFAVRIGKMNW